MNKLNVGRQLDQWKTIYEAALLECDSAKLTGLVASAELAIFYRLQSLPLGPEAQEERRAIEDAVNALYAIKRDVLKFPGIKFDLSSGSQEFAGLHGKP